MKKWIMTCALSTLLTGCFGDFHQVDEQTTGYLPAVSHAPVRVTVNHSVDTNQYKSMVYVSTQMHGLSNWPEYQDYIMQSVKHLGFFQQVITRQPTVYINTPAFAPTQRVNKSDWLDVDNHIPYNTLLKEYGSHFLVLDAELYTLSTDSEDVHSYFFLVKVIEPKSRRVLMTASNKMLVREGVDKGIINPVLDFTLGYLNFYDSTYPKPIPEPKTFEEWWEQLSDEFVDVMFV